MNQRKAHSNTPQTPVEAPTGTPGVGGIAWAFHVLDTTHHRVGPIRIQITTKADFPAEMVPQHLRGIAQAIEEGKINVSQNQHT